MSHVSDGTLALPFSGTTPLAQHCSQQGAQQALPRAGSQAWRIYLILKVETRTRHELAHLTSLPIPTVCARIGWLLQRGLIRECGSKKGPYGCENTMYTAA